VPRFPDVKTRKSNRHVTHLCARISRKAQNLSVCAKPVYVARSTNCSRRRQSFFGGNDCDIGRVSLQFALRNPAAAFSGAFARVPATAASSNVEQVS